MVLMIIFLIELLINLKVEYANQVRKVFHKKCDWSTRQISESFTTQVEMAKFCFMFTAMIAGNLNNDSEKAFLFLVST